MSYLKRILTGSLLLLMVSACGQVKADYISTLVIDLNTNTYEVFLHDDNTGVTEDTFGILGFALELDSVGMFTVENVAPRGTATNFATIFNPIGLTLPLGPDSVGGDRLVASSDPYQASWSHDILNPNAIFVPNLGRAGGNLNTFAGGLTVVGPLPPEYDVPLLVAQGEFTGAAPMFNESAGLVGYFTEATLDPQQSLETGLSYQTITVPEPSAGLLSLCVGGVALLKRRRRAA